MKASWEALLSERQIWPFNLDDIKERNRLVAQLRQNAETVTDWIETYEREANLPRGIFTARKAELAAALSAAAEALSIAQERSLEQLLDTLRESLAVVATGDEVEAEEAHAALAQLEQDAVREA